MKRVIIESPFAASTDEVRKIYAEYLKRCMRECLMQGEASFASHLLYAQSGILNDDDPDERTLGIEAGFAWGSVADYVVVYGDYNISSGMTKGFTFYRRKGLLIQHRFIGKNF